MSEQLNEFSMGSVLPMSLPATDTAPVMQMAVDPAPEAEMSVVSVPAETAPRSVSVYVDSTSVVDYSSDCPEVQIDLILSVNVTEPGKTCTYRVVKRIAMDRDKLAVEACATTPVTVVETVTEAMKINSRLKVLSGQTKD